MVKEFIEKRHRIEVVENTGRNFEELLAFCPKIDGFLLRGNGFAARVDNRIGGGIGYHFVVEPGECLINNGELGYAGATLDRILGSYDPAPTKTPKPPCTCPTCGQNTKG